jgi:cell wall-associated NlpC family hydrolase
MAFERTAVEIVSFKKLLVLLAFVAPCLSARPLLPPDPPALAPAQTASHEMPAALRLDVAAATAVTPGASGGLAAADAPVAHPRRTLADFAMKLRNIAYHRGGREPITGFDCSGFVHYVFDRALGLDLPSDSASQFNAGARVDRGGLKMGDLVFFRTKGRRISHVGIYLDNGLFIHSPSSGKRVRIDHLAETYWAKRYVGAKRPDALI